MEISTSNNSVNKESEDIRPQVYPSFIVDKEHIIGTNPYEEDKCLQSLPVDGMPLEKDTLRIDQSLTDAHEKPTLEPDVYNKNTPTKLVNQAFPDEGKHNLHRGDIQVKGTDSKEFPTQEVSKASQGLSNANLDPYDSQSLNTPTPTQVTSSLEQDGSRIILGCGFVSY
ncbi:hypothetical protein K7432_016206, partial [Basidiobolus ranarum]